MRARFLSLPVFTDCLQGNIAAVLSAHTGISEYASVNQIFQHIRAVLFQCCPAFRITCYFLIKQQFFLPDIEKSRGKYICMDLSALFQDILPVGLRAVSLRISHNVAYLPDTEAAVQKMFKRMKDQVEEMIRMAHCINRHAFDFSLYFPVKYLREHCVQAAVSL